jgi:hypothetical protein
MTAVKRWFAGITLAAIGAIVVATAEFAVRAIDGYRLFSSRLVQTRVLPAEPLAPSPSARHHVETIPVSGGVRREWFGRAPHPLARLPLSPELAAVSALGVTSDVFKQWNTHYLEEHVCSGDPLFRRFPGFAFSFEPGADTVHPPYRFLPNTTTPFGLVTNRFGFRGHEIAPDKPRGVIRIAFVGASTAVGNHAQAFSYPELMEPWLNLWASEAAPDVRFEVINAGREGISSPDIAAIVRDELAPLEPDVIVYHEGGNQFTPQTLVEEKKGPTAPPRDNEDSTREAAGSSALARRARIFLRRAVRRFGAEPRKPAYRLRWPATVSEQQPDPDASDLPLNLPQIVHDLDDIRQTASEHGATLVVTSFIWMVDRGLVVDPVDRAAFYDALNVKLWPVTYADIRRLADFQNRAFRAYAEKRGAPFIDVSERFPRDLTLFRDPVHMTLDGDRLRAWIMFQGLVPILEAKIAAGAFPQPDRTPFPTATANPPLQRTGLECTRVAGFVPAPSALTAFDLSVADESATLTGDRPKHLVTSGLRNGYAAAASIAATARVAKSGAVHVRLRVNSGRVAVGVLKPDRSAFLTYRTVEPNPEFTDLYLPLSSMSDAGFLMIANAVRQDGERSVVDIDFARVLLSR